MKTMCCLTLFDGKFTVFLEQVPTLSVWKRHWKISKTSKHDYQHKNGSKSCFTTHWWFLLGILVTRYVLHCPKLIMIVTKWTDARLTTPLYGYDSSVSMPPLSLMYLNAWSIRPPSHPWLPYCLEQSTKFCSLSDTSLLVLRKCWPSNAPVYIIHSRTQNILTSKTKCKFVAKFSSSTNTNSLCCWGRIIVWHPFGVLCWCVYFVQLIFLFPLLSAMLSHKIKEIYEL